MGSTAYFSDDAGVIRQAGSNRLNIELLKALLCAIFIILMSFNARAGEWECNRFKAWLRDNYAGQGSAGYDSRMASTNIEHRFIWENDAFTSTGDRHYTNGMKLSWLHNPCRKIWWDKFNSGYRNIASILLKSDSADITIGTGGVFGMNMYTPEIIDPARQRPGDPVVRREVNDRPYAGWLYAGVTYSAYVEPEYNPKDNPTFVMGTKAIMTEIQFGVIGPAAGQQYVQTWIHKDLHFSSNIPQGWEYQIPNRVGINILSAYQRNIFALNKYVRLTPVMGFSVGNVVNFINAGGIISVGIPFLGKPSDSFVYTTIQPALMKNAFSGKNSKIKSGSHDKSAGHAAFIFGVDARYINDSIFIEGAGAARHNILLTNFVYDIILGISYKPKQWDLAFTYKRIKRSSEFSHADGTDAASHTFGQIGVEWYF